GPLLPALLEPLEAFDLLCQLAFRGNHPNQLTLGRFQLHLQLRQQRFHGAVRILRLIQQRVELGAEGTTHAIQDSHDASLTRPSRSRPAPGRRVSLGSTPNPRTLEPQRLRLSMWMACPIAP